jgi:hydrogenase maturation protease
VALDVLAGWGRPGVPREAASATPLFDPSLALTPYESGRPGEDEACRIGDARVLAMRARAR